LSRSNKKRKSRQKTRVGHGLEFGIRPSAFALSGREFSSYLHSAQVGGCAYGVAFSPQLGARVPFISLIARKPAPLRSAFELFQTWDTEVGDALNLTFVFLTNGGYLLSLSPDTEALQTRTLGADRYFEPTVLASTWVKKIDTRHRALVDLRDWFTRPIAPFLLTGSYMTEEMEQPLKIPSCPELIKFEARLVDEADVSVGTQEHIALSVHKRSGEGPKRSGKRSGPVGHPKVDPHEVTKARLRNLSLHFPVTVWRIRTHDIFEEFRSRQSDIDVSESQFIQAYCNLQLSIQLFKEPHYPAADKKALTTSIAEWLRESRERADGRALVAFNDEVIRRQLHLDGSVFLRELGFKKIPASMQDVLRLVAHQALPG
jgi:hypothetical protein